MNYCSKIWVILFIVIVLSSQLARTQETTHEQVQASISKTVEKSASSNSPMVYGPISMKLVNESVINAIKKVAVAVRLRPVLDYDLIKKDKKVNLTFELASLPEALDQILQDMKIQYSITESGLLVFSEKQEASAAGSGTLKGRVLDKANNEALIGANIIIQNTSLGIAADVDGNFQLKLIPVGNWKVKVSCIGYVPITRDITIKEDETEEQEFRLTAQAIIGEEVIVTAQARGQVQAINSQLASDKIANMVSEARIQELPDFNAAQAISRLPGVSTLESSGEANKVVIRGLAPQLNQVSIGGVSVASTGSAQIGASSELVTSGSINNDRSVDLTMVSTYMIKSIEVYKSLTPDLNANAIGGIVNMSLREAPSGFHTDAMWQSGYTAKTTNYGNYRTVVSMSDRFFDDKVGLYIMGDAEKYDRDDDNMTANYSTITLDKNDQGYSKVMVDNVVLQRHLETRNRYGANLVLDYKYPEGIIRGIIMYSRLKSDFVDHSQTIDYKLGNMTFQYRSGVNTTDVGVNSLEFEHDFGFLSAEVKGGNTFSINSLPKSPLFRFFQTGGVKVSTSAQYDIPPENLLSQVTFKGDTGVYLSSMNLFRSEYQERDVFIKGDFKIPFQTGDILSGYMKFGGEYRKNVHTNDQNTPYFRPYGPSSGDNSDPNQNITKRTMQGVEANFPITMAGNGQFKASDFTSSDSKLFDSFLDNKFGQLYYVSDASMLISITDYIRGVPEFNANTATQLSPGGWTEDAYARLTNDYDYTEKYGASYLMSQLNVGPSLTIVGGARYEEVTSVFNAWNLVDRRNAKVQDSMAVTANPSNHFILPMVQAKYNLFEWSDIRYAYSNTLARADFHQLSPHYNISQYSKQVWAGNPKLTPAQATNHDLMITFHSNELGLLSIGAFYKEIKDFTYSTSYKLRDHPLSPGLDSLGTYSDQVGLQGVYTLYTYVNSSSLAFIRGIEFDLQTRFWYLPFPLDGLLLGINYTHISSETTYPYRDEYTTGRPPRTTLVLIDSTRSGRMINQPNDIANLFIGYDYKGFSAKVTMVYQGNSVSFIGAYPEQDGFTADYYRVDVSVRQILPWAGLQLFLDVNNLNNRQNVSRQITIDGFTSQKNYGLTANLGVRYTFAMQ
jgi:TonB-dependent receptor